MDFDNIMSRNVTEYVTNRYKVTKQMDEKLREIEEKLNVPPSAIVRLALNCFLPKVRDDNFKYEGIKNIWNTDKF